jgi:hypothetical protein
MVFHFPSKGQRFLFTLIGFLTFMAAILVSSIYIYDELPQIKKKIKKTIYKFTKPSIPSVMNADILKNLQGGGHTVFIRHSARNKIKNLDIFDQLSMVEEIKILPTLFKGGCLNPQGKTEAWLIGEVFKELKIPVGLVYSSPTCRTKETAKRAFGRIDVVAPNLYFQSFYIGTGLGTIKTKQNNQKKALEIIKKNPAEGKNKIIVAHSGMLQQLGWPNSNLKESAMFIVRHAKDGNLEVVTEITLGSFIGAMRLEGILGTVNRE